MDIAETIKKIIQEIVVPEFDQLRSENSEIKAILSLTNKRLDDMHDHIFDLSRRIDECNKRIDETNKRIDELRAELKEEINKNTLRIDEINTRIDSLNTRIDRLYEVIVKREDHERLEFRVFKLEQEISLLKARVAS